MDLKKITELPAQTVAQLSDVWVMVRSGVTSQLPMQALYDLLLSAVNTLFGDHAEAEDPHPQYLTPEDLPASTVLWLAAEAHPSVPSQRLLATLEPSNPESSIDATTAGEGVPVLWGEWLRDTLYDQAITLAEFDATVQLDVVADQSTIVDIWAEFYVVHGGFTGSQELITASDHHQGSIAMRRAISLRYTLVSGSLDIAVGDAFLIKVYVSRAESGGPAPSCALYIEGNNVSRTITRIPQGGGGGVTVHNELTGRDIADGHSTSAITDLDSAQAAQNSRLDVLEAVLIERSLYNLIDNGNFIVAARGNPTKTPGDNIYGYDRWRGAPFNRLKQTIHPYTLPFVGDYTLSWQGGGTGTLDGGSSSVSPITAFLFPGTQVEVQVPAVATEVQLEFGTTARPFQIRSVSEETRLCEQYFRKIAVLDGGMIAYKTAAGADTLLLGFSVTYPSMIRLPVQGSSTNLTMDHGNCVSSNSDLVTTTCFTHRVDALSLGRYRARILTGFISLDADYYD